MLLDTATASSTHAPVFADEYDFRLLNNFQRDFPLTPRPFADIAARLGVTEAEILAALREMEERAAMLGANAIVGVDLDYEVINNMLMVSASGTAVTLG